MYLYRGKDIGGRERLIETCRKIIHSGSAEQLYDIIPHIRVLRDTSLLEPLKDLLREGNPEQRSAAAMALGSLGMEHSVAPLMGAFRKLAGGAQRADQPFQLAVIAALGDLNCDSSVTALMEIYRMEAPSGRIGANRANLVLSSLGHLAQQQIESARQELLNLCYDPDESLRSQAATELAVAFWHTPQAVPEKVLERIFEMATDDDKRTRAAAIASLSSLAQLGSEKAGDLVRQLT